MIQSLYIHLQKKNQNPKRFKAVKSSNGTRPPQLPLLRNGLANIHKLRAKNWTTHINENNNTVKKNHTLSECIGNGNRIGQQERPSGTRTVTTGSVIAAPKHKGGGWWIFESGLDRLRLRSRWRNWVWGSKVESSALPKSESWVGRMFVWKSCWFGIVTFLFGLNVGCWK